LVNSSRPIASSPGYLYRSCQRPVRSHSKRTAPDPCQRYGLVLVRYKYR
jgi:hypothetical protein